MLYVHYKEYTVFLYPDRAIFFLLEIANGGGLPTAQDIVKGIDSLENIGCFGLTELGYVMWSFPLSPARFTKHMCLCLHTAGTATMRWRWRRQPFLTATRKTLVCIRATGIACPGKPQHHNMPLAIPVINTPSTAAQKYWITNSAVHAKYCVVFARLIVNGQDEGLHGLVVKIRNNDNTVCDGVRIWDMGHKVCLRLYCPSGS